MKRLWRSERGTSVAELALVMPTFLLILFGIVEGCVVLSAWMVLTNETREAARYAVAGVRDGSTTLVTDVTNLVNTDLGSLLSGGVTVTVNVASNAAGPTAVSVLADYNVPMQTPFTKAILGTVAVHASSTMRAE